MRVIPQLIGYPRIGPDRDLKWALERRWSGRLEREEFEVRVADLHRSHLYEQRNLVGQAVDDYFLYDQVLETAVMLGIVPDRFRGLMEDDPFQALTALARGTKEVEAWEMTKWFDTNYHYVVPEIDRSPGLFRPLPWRIPSGDERVTWAVLGPYSLVSLSKLGESLADEPQELAAEMGRALWIWVREIARQLPEFRLQVDEPCLGLEISLDREGLLRAAYLEADDLGLSSPAVVTAQFAQPSQSTIRFLGEKGMAVQIGLDQLSHPDPLEHQPELVVSVMDGRSVWPDRFERVAEALEATEVGDRTLRIVPSTSLMFLPYTTEGEGLADDFWFARQKAAALKRWATALETGEHPRTPTVEVPDFPEPQELVGRAARSDRRTAQKDLGLPEHPTTTTGSLPQTPEVRKVRSRFQKGEITEEEYREEVDRFIREAIEWQEEVGLDVLVHGEFERSDMVEYFAQKMDGFHTTGNGWVLSYGSRCVRPPILAAPPSIEEPMTVREWQVAQEATGRPVKGMLTGPVTMVNWSFRPPEVPDDRLFWAVAQPIAKEVRYLAEAGARVIQIDEPAVRERWPLPTADAEERRKVYGRGVQAALNLVFNAPPEVQMHTHMCYGDFGDIVPLWSNAGVDVASIEYSRSKDDSYIRQFYELFENGRLQIGPGVFDVHSPHTPGEDVMAERLDHFLRFMAPADLWVNPDCGLKTRRWEEIEVQLSDLVAAARRHRSDG